MADDGIALTSMAHPPHALDDQGFYCRVCGMNADWIADHPREPCIPSGLANLAYAKTQNPL